METNLLKTNVMETNLLKKYIDAGVHQNKIIITGQPSVCFWSTSRKCLVSENGIEALEVIKTSTGLTITGENNIPVSLQIRSELTKDDINKINNSNGIIITDAVYGKPYFRYGFIPTSDIF